MNDKKILKLVFASLMAALAFVATRVFIIPTPMGGYVNAGDCFVLAAGWLLGPLYGALAAGIGPALADATAGYGMYVIPTFLIKACMAIVAWSLFRAMNGKRYISVAGIASALAAEAVMIAGYYICEAFVFGYGAVASLASVPGNLVQGAFGAVVGIALMRIFRRIVGNRL